jgi:hypothetical protein
LRGGIDQIKASGLHENLEEGNLQGLIGVIERIISGPPLTPPNLTLTLSFCIGGVRRG